MNTLINVFLKGSLVGVGLVAGLIAVGAVGHLLETTIRFVLGF